MENGLKIMETGSPPNALTLYEVRATRDVEALRAQIPPRRVTCITNHAITTS